jgi:DNA mismatch repair protein MutS
LIVHECAVCKYKPSNKHDRDLETHHINFQKDCYNKKVIAKPHVGMNDLSNLVILCRPCHKKIHESKMSIKGYLKTSNGKKIDISS